MERSGPPWPSSAAGDRSSGRATGQHDDRSVALHRRQQRSLKRGRAAGRSPPRSHPGRSGFRSRPLTERALRPVALALPPTAAHGGEGPATRASRRAGRARSSRRTRGRACESPRRRRRPAHAHARRAQRTAGHAPKITDRGLRRLDRASHRGRLTGVGRVGTTEDVSAVDSPELDLDDGPVVRGALDAPLRADLLQRSGRPLRRSRRDRAAPSPRLREQRGEISRSVMPSSWSSLDTATTGTNDHQTGIRHRTCDRIAGLRSGAVERACGECGCRAHLDADWQPDRARGRGRQRDRHQPRRARRHQRERGGPARRAASPAGSRPCSTRVDQRVRGRAATTPSGWTRRTGRCPPRRCSAAPATTPSPAAPARTPCTARTATTSSAAGPATTSCSASRATT